MRLQKAIYLSLELDLGDLLFNLFCYLLGVFLSASRPVDVAPSQSY
jgi:hypothetical protein